MILLDKPLPFSEALDRLAQKRVLTTGLSSAELRQEFPAALRQRALFSARTTKAAILQEYQDKLGALLDGKTNLATARMEMQQLFDALGYTPERGFAGDEEHDIPPAERGSLRDLSSRKRIDLVLTTNLRQCANFGFWKQGQSDFALFAYPCYELIRIYPRQIPRGLRLSKGALEHVEGEDWPSRWETVGGTFYGLGRMIARKDDEIWGRLGDSAIFPDALDTFLPPFAFNSGYGWREIDRAEAIKLGVINEETEVEGQRHDLNENLQASVEAFDPEFLRAVKRELELDIAEGRARLVRNRDLPAPALKPLPQFHGDEFILPDGTTVAANSGFDPSQPRGYHGRFAKLMFATDKGMGGSGVKPFDAVRANNWKPAAKEYRRALAEGRATMERCIQQKRDALGAVERPGLGKIDFRYGKPGTPPTFSDGFGISKIISKRDYEAQSDPDFAGQTGKHVARAMVETLLRGKVGAPYENGQKVNIVFKHFSATLARSFHGAGNRWLLTGFIDRTKRKAARS